MSTGNRVDNKQISYQPKGSMCLACKQASRDCSGLAFNQMLVIEKHEDLRIVKCRDFEKATDATTKQKI